MAEVAVWVTGSDCLSDFLWGEADAFTCWKYVVSACSENTQNRSRRGDHHGRRGDRRSARPGGYIEA
ncbi:hypothetical protein GCM10010228_79430 [Streptomyces massasporeus]|nr:hypothetical protein GCM10010228_79430 [Streptomyces massasporeus]